jgi:hypothetical protein
MGNSNSAATNNYINSSIVNQSTLDVLTQVCTTQVTNTIMEGQTTAAGSSITTAVINAGPNIAIGKGSEISDIKYSIDINSSIVFNSSISTAQNSSIATSIANTLSTLISTSLTAAQKSVMVSATKSEQELAALAAQFGNTNSSTTNNSTTLRTENIVDQSIRNIITTIVENNTTITNIQSCIVQHLSSNTINAQGNIALDGAKIRGITYSIKDTSSVVGNCVFNTIQGSGVLGTIATDFGLKIDTDLSAEQSAFSSATTTAAQTVQGLFESSGIMSLIILIVLVGAFLLIFKVVTGGKGNSVKRK